MSGDAAIFAKLQKQVDSGNVSLHGDDVDLWRLFQNTLLYTEQSANPVLGLRISSSRSGPIDTRSS